MAVLEFGERAGLWTLAAFRDNDARRRWKAPIQAAFRLLADSGFGGERSLGFGHCQMPQFQDCKLPDVILRQASAESLADARGSESDSDPVPNDDREGAIPAAAEPPPPPASAWWVLSLFSPASTDEIDWNGGSYSVVTRGGRIESSAQWGATKRLVRMISEGSVLRSPSPPSGAAPNVAPDDFPHPVFRSGHAVSIAIPWRVNI